MVVVLPAPFVPSKPKTSPGCDLEVDSAHSLVVPVLLAQPADDDRRFSQGEPSCGAQAIAGCAELISRYGDKPFPCSETGLRSTTRILCPFAYES